MSPVMDCVKDAQWSMCAFAEEVKNNSLTQVYTPAMISLPLL